MTKLTILNIPHLREIIARKERVNGNLTQKYKRAKNIMRILERDHFACVVCGNEENLTIDHINGSKGLSHSQYQIYPLHLCQTLCKKCHNKKNNRKNNLVDLICEDCCRTIKNGFKGQKCNFCGGRTR